MLYLMQILNVITDLDLFEGLFSDLQSEAEELGYEGRELDLVADMLSNHFGLVLEDERQLALLTEAMLKTELLRSAINITRLKKAG